MARDYIGGRGFGIFTMLAELDPNCDPLGPENILIMATGPLTGTRAPTGARYMVMTKSPLTGAITCSNSGGNFPAMLKKSGIDMIVFKGKASEPVCLWINAGSTQLRPAIHLWVKTPMRLNRSCGAKLIRRPVWPVSVRPVNGASCSPAS